VIQRRAARVLPTVTGFATWLAIAALRKSDVLIAPLLQCAGLWIHDFEDRRSRISAAAQAKFLEDAARAIDDSAFALHLAANATPREEGLLFYAASAARAGRIRRLLCHLAQNKNESWSCLPRRKRGASCGKGNDGAASVVPKHMKK
jgi:hypothetical protein